MNIVFMGTPEFAVQSLEAILNSSHKIQAVVTVPDKPAGRGLKPTPSAVKLFAEEKKLTVFQPNELQEEWFVQTLQQLAPELIVVVAFKKLPKTIWSIASKGTINLHASLLPKYRGAAPINWAIINGEKETGVTTFFINEEIDKGNIILQEKLPISDTDTAGSLYEKMKVLGSQLLVRTLDTIEKGSYNIVNQEDLIAEKESLPVAPKIYKHDCCIDWNQPSLAIYNKIRGLSPYPTAYTELISPNQEKYYIKIFSCRYTIIKHSFPIGQIIVEKFDALSIATIDGLITLEEIQMEGRKKMHISQFLKGFSIGEGWKV